LDARRLAAHPVCLDGILLVVGIPLASTPEELDAGALFFIVTYAVLLFLLAVLLLPRDWATTDSLDDYFLSKRKWFYPLYLIAIFADIVDAWLKGGWPYMRGIGVLVFAYWAAAIPVCVVGVRSKNTRIHAAMAITISVWQLIVVFEIFPKLGL
jgi:hypothetical protein